jgi:hypothetical protein
MAHRASTCSPSLSLRRLQLPLLTFAVLVFSPLAADAAPYAFRVFGGASYISPLSSSDRNVDGVIESLEASEELGWEVGAEARLGQILGLEASYLRATQDIELGGTVIGEIDFAPIFVSLNLHLVSSRAFDLWIGPTVAFVDWGEIDLLDGTSFDLDSEEAYGASIGLEIGIGPSLALSGGVRWIEAGPEVEGFEELAVDPLFARVGLALRF